MRVRRLIFYSILGNKTNIKVVAFLLALKKQLGVTSTLKDFSCKKVAKVIGVHPNTAKKYLDALSKAGYVEIHGKNKNILTIKRITSKTRHCNIDISKFDFSSFKSIYNSVKSFLFIFILSHKEYLKRMIRMARNPRYGEDFKEAIKACNRYAKKTQNGHKFIDWGFSYKKIGAKIGFCERTAESIVKHAIKKRWCKKQTNFLWTYLPGVNGMFVDGFTFTTRDYGFVVKANTYKICRSWCMVLIDGKK